jgi:protein arginine kinase activator
MLCQVCKKQSATIHLTEIQNGHREETHLCEGCAQQQGLSIKSQIPLNELLSTLLSAQGQAKSSGKLEESLPAGQACPACGMTLKEFGKKSLLGCPADYDFFREHLEPLIEKSQAGHTRHCGKVPSRTPIPAKNQIELAQLQKDLDAAVRAEDYESAARLRDRIKQLQIP